MLTFEALAGRDVAILGTGVEGEAAWRAIRSRHGDLPLTLYTESPERPEWCAALDPERDRLVQGALDARALARHELLLRSPGISPYRPELEAALAAGRTVTTPSSLWFAEYPQARTICITGTKGKSTTTALVHHLLAAAGLRAAVAGNIGRPLVTCDPSEADWWVVELSSYQICDLHAAPTVAVLLNLSDEHLDWHGGRERYRRDKLRLAWLAAGGTRIANWGDPLLRAALEAERGVLWFNRPDAIHANGTGLARGETTVLDTAPPSLPGRHNLDNLAAAATTVAAVATLPSDLAGALEDFAGLPHRLRRLGERDGRVYYDDSLSTTPVATLAALDALRGAPVTVLVGGLDRGLDWGEHAEAFARAAPHALVGLPDSGAVVIERLADAGVNAPGGLHTVDDLDAAVRLADAVTPAGGIVLLSPGAPSFPRFRDYRERGEAFARAAGFAVDGA